MRTALNEQLRAIGIEPGDTLMIHASMRKAGRLENGADGLIDGLLAAVDVQGTLFAYADFEPTADVPYFDPARSPCMADHGVFPEVLRKRAGTLRSANPGASVLALGARAHDLTHPHPLNYGYGPGTPFERFVTCGGKVLLIGSSLDAVTILHYVEAIADLPNKRLNRYTAAVWDNGEARNLEIEEFDTSDPILDAMPPDYFERLIRAFIASHGIEPKPIGNAPSYLLDARTLVRDAKARMEAEYGAT